MNEEKKVEVPASELSALLKEMQSLKAQVSDLQSNQGIGAPRLLKKVNEQKVHVRVIDGRVVVGFRNRGSEQRPQYVYDQTDPKDPTKIAQYVDLIFDGMKDESEAIPVKYSEFLKEADRVLCKVVNVREEEWEIEQGIVRKREVDGYSTLETDFDVPVMVTGTTRFYTVQLPNSENTITLHQKYCNM